MLKNFQFWVFFSLAGCLAIFTSLLLLFGGEYSRLGEVIFYLFLGVSFTRVIEFLSFLKNHIGVPLESWGATKRFHWQLALDLLLVSVFWNFKAMLALEIQAGLGSIGVFIILYILYFLVQSFRISSVINCHEAGAVFPQNFKNTEWLVLFPFLGGLASYYYGIIDGDATTLSSCVTIAPLLLFFAVKFNPYFTLFYKGIVQFIQKRYTFCYSILWLLFSAAPFLDIQFYWLTGFVFALKRFGHLMMTYDKFTQDTLHHILCCKTAEKGGQLWMWVRVTLVGYGLTKTEPVKIIIARVDNYAQQSMHRSELRHGLRTVQELKKAGLITSEDARKQANGYLTMHREGIKNTSFTQVFVGESLSTKVERARKELKGS